MAIVSFLIGVIVSATSGLGEKINAVAQLVGLGREDAVPDAYKNLIGQPVPAGTGAAGTGGTGGAGAKVVYLPAPEQHHHLPWWLIATVVLALWVAWRWWRMRRRERLHRQRYTPARGRWSR